MTPPRIAVATSPFRLPIRRAIPAAAECGAQGVQFDARTEVKPEDYGETARRQLLYELSERSLSVASLTFPLRRPLHDAEHLDLRIAAIRQAMEFAAQLRAKTLTVRGGRLPEAADSPDLQRLRDVLRDLARFGNHVGVVLALTHVGDLPAPLVALIQEIKEGPLGIDFDPAACVLARRNPSADLREAHSVVTHIQVRDAIRDFDGAGLEVPVGRGEVDWPEILALVGEMHYTGWLTVRRTTGDDILGDTARAVQFIQNVALGH
jgi:sugar phosphate isomerase/epimerase